MMSLKNFFYLLTPRVSFKCAIVQNCILCPTVNGGAFESVEGIGGGGCHCQAWYWLSKMLFIGAVL